MSVAAAPPIVVFSSCKENQESNNSTDGEYEDKIKNLKFRLAQIKQRQQKTQEMLRTASGGIELSQTPVTPNPVSRERVVNISYINSVDNKSKRTSTTRKVNTLDPHEIDNYCGGSRTLPSYPLALELDATDSLQLSVEHSKSIGDTDSLQLSEHHPKPIKSVQFNLSKNARKSKNNTKKQQYSKNDPKVSRSSSASSTLATISSFSSSTPNLSNGEGLIPPYDPFLIRDPSPIQKGNTHSNGVCIASTIAEEVVEVNEGEQKQHYDESKQIKPSTRRNSWSEEMTFNDLRELEKQKKKTKKTFDQIARLTDCVYVNGRPYIKIEEIGQGGSCTVFKVMSTDLQMCALKCVKWKGEVDETVNMYKNEIRVLAKLRNKPNIVQLLDYEVKDHVIYLLLELGEIDLHRMIANEKKAMSKALKLEKTNGTKGKKLITTAKILQSGIGINYARLFWQQMLEAVNTIHEERIVHGDLKPANFVCFKGRLKLIDFGIANSISSDTTNIIRESMLGTINYMSPEQLQAIDNTDGDGTDQFKVGRASDIWSLGCILYQMVYGRPPFHKYRSLLAKFAAIPDPKKEIPFLDIDNPPLVDMMRICLNRNARERPTIPELLQHKWLQ